MRFESGADQTLNAAYTFSRLFYFVGVYLAAFWAGGVYEIPAFDPGLTAD